MSMPPVGFEPTISAGERLQTARLRPRGHLDRRQHFIAKCKEWVLQSAMYLSLLLEVDLQSFSNFSARKKCVVRVTPRPLYPRERTPFTHWMGEEGGGGWVEPKHAAGEEKKKMYWSPSGNQTPIP